MDEKILTKGSADRRLRQHITPLSAWALSIGTSIGWGSFVITSNTYLSGAGPTIMAVVHRDDAMFFEKAAHLLPQDEETAHFTLHRFEGNNVGATLEHC